ncbi:MAG: DUF4115 domain-containing protein [Candidatus Omnitrophica bacterium]|nr:DUF4115 domain-containing protein [Candidatus Omnitrophota bacterium]
MEQRDFTMTKTQKAILGEKLKQARERKSLTIDQVQRQTKIYSNVIIALEDGRCDEVVPALYVKSFLKKYAQFLGLDPAAVTREYGFDKERVSQREFIKERPEKQAPSRQAIQTIRQMPSGSPLRLIRLAGFAVLALAVIFTSIYVGKKVFAAFNRPRIIVRGSSSAVIKGRRASSAATSAKRATRPFTLVLKVKEPVWVEVRKDGEELYKRVLPKGTAETFKADQKMEFYIAKAASVDLVLDGKRIKLPAKGVLKHLEVTKKGVAW